MELPILYEDADVVVIDKPVGVMAHPDSHSSDETVSDWFAARYPDSREVGETQTLPDNTVIGRPGIVHRLDRDTSGVLVLAKTQEAHAFLKHAFQEHEIQKTYLAFVYGTFKEDLRGTITFPIGRSNKDFRLRSAQRGAKGKLREAITRWEVIGQTSAHALLRVQPLTGRTHQIRVHLKAIHHPIVCDPLYAPNHPCDLGFSRLGLHAHQLELTLPSGEHKTFTSPLPPELVPAAVRLGYKDGESTEG
jgi:23S rRNA pseudouridine1911/1915/1917 synthase